MKKKIIFPVLAAVMLCGCARQAEVPSAAEDALPEQTKILEEYRNSPEFTGIAFNKDAAPCPSINNKSYFPKLFCFHDGTVYYANPRDGLKLYSYDGSEARKLTDIPATSPLYRDGEIYFLSSSDDYIHDSGNEKGKLYKYSVESEETVLLSDTAIRALLSDEAGIYYCVYESKSSSGWYKTAFYKFDEESGDSEKVCDGAFFQRYGDIELLFIPSEELSDLVICLKKGDEVYRLLKGVIPAQYGIWEGKFYYCDQNTRELFSIDLANGEKSQFGKTGDYTVLNGELYYQNQDKLYKAGSDDLKITYSGEFFPEQDESKIQDRDYHFLALYTTGSEMYALMEWRSDAGAVLNGIARITVSENGGLSVELLP